MLYPSTDKKYYLKYELVRDPFPVDTIDKVLYFTPELNRRLEQLKRLLKASEEILVVISPAGAGKTVIAEHLETLKEPNWMVSLVQGNEDLDMDSLALAILQKVFPGKEFEKSQAVNQIHKFLESLALNGKIPVLIIDDAHKLSFESLQFILQLADLRHQDSLFRIVLFANESINDLFEKQGLKELTSGVLHRINLPPFSKEQTKAYIENRLSLSGKNSENPFSQNDINQIFRISAGLPRSINFLARQLMQYKTEQKSSKPGRAGHLLFAVVIIFVLIISSYYYYSINQHTSVDNLDIAIAIPPQKPLSEIEPQEVQVPEERDQTFEIEKQMFEAQVSLELPKPVRKDDVQNDLSKPASLKEPEIIETQIASLSEEEKAVVEEVKVFMEQEEKAKIVVDKAEDGGQVIAGPSVTYSGNKTENIYNLDYIPQIVNGIKGPDWLRQQPTGLFVLQIMSARKFSNVERMLDKLPAVQDQLSGYTNYTPSGKPRFLLYYGLYTNSGTALDAVEGLPPLLQSVKPWPRDIKSIVNQLDDLELRGYY